jgi:hypothetical protein
MKVFRTEFSGKFMCQSSEFLYWTAAGSQPSLVPKVAYRLQVCMYVCMTAAPNPWSSREPADLLQRACRFTFQRRKQAWRKRKQSCFFNFVVPIEPETPQVSSILRRRISRLSACASKVYVYVYIHTHTCIYTTI